MSINTFLERFDVIVFIICSLDTEFTSVVALLVPFKIFEDIDKRSVNNVLRQLWSWSQ